MRRRRVLVAAIGLTLAGCSGGDRKAAAEISKPAHPSPDYSASSLTPVGAMKAEPIAPGRVVAIYGAHLGPDAPCHGQPEASRGETPHPLRPNQTAVETQVFPTRLCETEVHVDGVAAGLLYVSRGQINFKVPQTTPVRGSATVRVAYRGVAGPSVLVPLTAGAASGSSEQLAAAMLAGLQRVKWQRRYDPDSPGEQCTPLRAMQALRGGFYENAFRCARTPGAAPVAEESVYFPVNHEAPQLLLLRADFRPASTYAEMDDEVEQRLIERLTKAYGQGLPEAGTLEIGISRLHPGRRWRNGAVTIFLHRSRHHAASLGLREGVALTAVRQEVLAQRDEFHRLQEQQEASVLRPRPPVKSETERVKAEAETHASLLRLLRQPAGADPEEQAATLLAADELAVRLGSLLVARSVDHGSERLEIAGNAVKVRRQLAALGVRYGEAPNHYSGDLEYDRSLLARAWKEHPETSAGQRAFLKLQRLGCVTPLFGCDGPNCFLAVITRGGAFLERHPDPALRLEQLHHLALAHDTWWSLAQAEPGDISAQGAKVTPESGERARLRAIELYEQLLEAAPPASREAVAARRSLPRLKLKLDTGERTFFCFSC